MIYDLYSFDEKVGETRGRLRVFLWLLRNAKPVLSGYRIDLKAVNRKTGKVEALTFRWLQPMPGAKKAEPESIAPASRFPA